MEEMDLAAQTMFAELLQRSLDAEFDAEFPEKGSFKRKKSKGRLYWHYQWRDGEKVRNKYVGPATDAGIASQIERFGEIKSSFKRRQTLIRALIAAGLPTPDPLSGAIVEAMWKAGFFRLRGVLVGTLAFQTYAGPLGVNLGSRPLMTQDADFAQFWGISENIGESIADPLTILRGVDPTFRAIPHLKDPNVSTRYRNRMDYAVDFLTPNRGSADHQGRPARMKALGGAGAQPLRHLDFLLHQTERSVLLYGGGVPVTVPRAERYAVHKLIVAVERVEQAKAPKDILQAHTLIQALALRRPAELAQAWKTAWASGDQWRKKLDAGRQRLPMESQETLDRLGAVARTPTRRARQSTKTQRPVPSTKIAGRR
jgi:hypothetical protein